MANKLDIARQIINEVDAQMAELFVKRMCAAELVYEHKKEFGLPILDQSRENIVIEKNLALIEEDILKEYYVDFLKHLMSVSRAYQYRLQNGLKVAYSGVEGAFAHIAAGKIYPKANRVSYSDFKAAYNSVQNGECDVAVLPIENSYAGEVGQTMDLILPVLPEFTCMYVFKTSMEISSFIGKKRYNYKYSCLCVPPIYLIKILS